MMIRYIFLVLLFTTPFFNQSWAQYEDDPIVESHNGWNLAPEGRMHIMVIFADINFDSTYGHLDPVKKGGEYLWKAGELPEWRDKFISADPEGNGFITDYFRQASFGKYQVTGDYVDQQITLNISDIRDRNGRVVTQDAFANRHYKQAVAKKVNEIENLKFRWGSSLQDFDNLTLSAPGMPKKLQPNGNIDLVMIIFRNIHVNNLGNNSGFVSMGGIGDIKGLKSDMFSIFRTNNFAPKTIMRHEFSHMLYGGNNFHTANGGVGQRTFMPTVGGWSNMSASDACSRVFNAWDRERMGWQNPQNTYLVNARCQSGKDVNGILEYGKHTCGDVYVLRDFVTTGDAIKIPLPHIPGNKKRQYLWLENHQVKEDAMDHDNDLPPGLMAYIQAGKDTRKGNGVYGGENNYLWPLPAFGSYDFQWRGDTLLAADSLENAFTGHHYLMRVPRDLNNDGKIRLTTDVRPKSEYTLASALEVNGELMPKSYFCYKEYPIFGTKDVPFTQDGPRKMGISYNPSTTPVYTYAAPGGPRPYDVRRIYLNGISVEILRKGEDGELYLRIRWDDFDIVKDARWCGNILSNEEIRVKEGNTITLDQGYAPQIADKPQVGANGYIFADPTILELASGSKMTLEAGANLHVKAGSTLLLRAGSVLEIGKKASVTIDKGAFLYMEQGAKVEFTGKKGIFDVNPLYKQGINPLLEREFTNLKEQDKTIPENRN